MKLKLISLLLMIITPLVAQEKATEEKSCDCCKEEKSVSPAEVPKKYPVRGVIIDVLAEKSALLVKHEAIPGLMPAMTMTFNVEAATLKAAAKGQTITATLTKEDGEFWLREVKPASTTL